MQKGILITGGGHGIGKQICRDFLEAGAQVGFIDFDKEDIVNRNEDDILYGIIKNSKNSKKMNFLSRIFMKEDIIYHKIRIVTERNC